MAFYLNYVMAIKFNLRILLFRVLYVLRVYYVCVCGRWKGNVGLQSKVARTSAQSLRHERQRFFFFSIFISTLIFVLAGIGATCIHVLRIFIHIVNALLDSLLRVSNKSETVSSSFSYLWHCIIMPLGRTTNVISINLSSNPIYEYAYGGGGGVFMC